MLASVLALGIFEGGDKGCEDEEDKCCDESNSSESGVSAVP